MKPAPTQYEVKSLFSLVIPRGAQKLIARGMGVSDGDISRRFNPNDDRKLGTAEGLVEQFHIIQTCPADWPTLRAGITCYWDEWETRGLLPAPTPAQIIKAQNDYVLAEIENQLPSRKAMRLARLIALQERRLVCIESGPSDLRKVS